MIGLAARAASRHYAHHPWQLLLTVLGVALGVAVVVAVDLANDAAARAFALSSETLLGRATHQVIGGPAGLDEQLYVRLRRDAGLREAAPVVEGFVRAGGETLQLLGVDPFAEGAVRGHLAGLEGGATTRLLTEAGTLALPDVTAARLGVGPGGRLRIAIGEREHEVEVAAVIATDAASRARLDGLAFADIATAQELLGLLGRLGWIDLVLPDGAAGERREREVRALLPASAELVPAASRARAMAQMTRAFRINLTAMSLLALLVGMFLIYNTMTFAVLQRRALLGQLRALGVTRGGLFALVLREGLMVGAAGTVLGLLAGIALGHGLVGLVARTINDLYFVVNVTGLPLAPLPLAKGAVLGLLASVAAVLLPAREAALTPPRLTLLRSVVEARAHTAAPRLAAAGLALMLLALALLWLPSRSLTLAFAALFLALIGATLVVPLLVSLATRLPGPAVSRRLGPSARLALRGIDAALSRTGVAIAALMLAVATTVGVGVMVASFRAGVAGWLETALRADLYVTAPSLRSNRAATHLEPALVARLRTVPGVAEFTSARRVVVESAAGLDELMALDVPPQAGERITVLGGPRAAALRAFFAAEAVLVSEPYAWHRGLGPGAQITLRTDRGPRSFTVAGVYRDYGSDRGEILMLRALYERYWDDRYITTLGVLLAPGADEHAVAAALRAEARPDEPMLVRSTREVRRESLAIFDRTFTITGVLRLLAVGAAVIGILSALMALALERAREFGVLRALGFTPGQVRALVLTQTAAMGLAAGLLALPTGTLLAALLVHAINRRAFGWSMDLLLPAGVYLEAVVLALASALLAGVLPAWRLARARPAESLREE